MLRDRSDVTCGQARDDKHRDPPHDLAAARRVLMLEIARRTRFSSRPQLGAISSSRCQKSRASHPRRAKSDTSGRVIHSQQSHSRRSIRWWSQTGSNRRPPACKAGALPAELWPRSAEHCCQSELEAKAGLPSRSSRQQSPAFAFRLRRGSFRLASRAKAGGPGKT